VISYLSGKVLKKLNDYVIFLTNSGIGFKVITPYPNDIDKEVYIYQIINEKENTLYGFNSFEEVEFFEKLLKIPQVGPKSIIQILKTYSLDEINKRVSKGETLLVKGVRKKVLDDIYKFLSEEKEEIIISNDKTKDLIKILLSLGFEKDDIYEAIKKVSVKEDISIEDYVKKVLKVLKNE
jgi:Holliday junction DNA helicase RuvA